MPAPHSNSPSVHENLQRVNTPQQMARGYALNSFERPSLGMVGRDKTAGNEWYLLGKSLSGLGQAWDLASKVWIDRWKEKGIAEGRTLWTNTEEENQNRSKFKEFVEANPQYANDNPWVKVGFEQSRMRTLGLDLSTGLQKMMTESNLYNEKDEKKVTKAIDDFIAGYRKQWGLETYEDPITMAEHFSPLQLKAKTGTMAMWNEAQRNNRMEELKNQAISEMVAHYLAGDVQGAEAAREQALQSGLLDRHGMEVTIGALRTAYEKTNNPKFLELFKQTQFKGVTAIDTPEGSRFYNSTMQYRIEKAKNDAERALRMAEMNYSRQSRNLASELYTTFDPNDPEAVAKLRATIDEKMKGAPTYAKLDAFAKTMTYYRADKAAKDVYQDSDAGNIARMERFNDANEQSGGDPVKRAQIFTDLSAQAGDSTGLQQGISMQKQAANGQDLFGSGFKELMTPVYQISKDVIEERANNMSQLGTKNAPDKVTDEDRIHAQVAAKEMLDARQMRLTQTLVDVQLKENGGKAITQDQWTTIKKKVAEDAKAFMQSKKFYDFVDKNLVPASQLTYPIQDARKMSRAETADQTVWEESFGKAMNMNPDFRNNPEGFMPFAKYCWNAGKMIPNNIPELLSVLPRSEFGLTDWQVDGDGRIRIYYSDDPVKTKTGKMQRPSFSFEKMQGMFGMIFANKDVLLIRKKSSWFGGPTEEQRVVMTK